MPDLLVFAPCEKVIISQDDNNPTLITILTELGGAVEVELEQLGAEGPSLMPFSWSIFTMWAGRQEESGKDFEQEIKMVAPSGKVASLHATPFAIEKTFHRLNLRFHGMPVREAGMYSLELYVREKGASWPTQPIARYPLKIRFELVQAAEGAANENT